MLNLKYALIRDSTDSSYYSNFDIIRSYTKKKKNLFKKFGSNLTWPFIFVLVSRLLRREIDF